MRHRKKGNRSGVLRLAVLVAAAGCGHGDHPTVRGEVEVSADDDITGFFFEEELSKMFA